MSASAGFAIINGRPLHPDTGQAVDGLHSEQPQTTSTPTKTAHVKQEAAPTTATRPAPARPQRRSIDGLGGPIRPKPVPKQPIAITQPRQQTVSTTAPTTEQLQPQTNEAGADKQHLIQSRSLSDNRAQRAQSYRQHHAISKFGKLRHEDRSAEAAAIATSQPLATTYKPSEELAVQSVIQQVYHPTGSINRHLATNDRQRQPKPDTDADHKQSALFSWLNPSARTMKIATATMSVIVLSAYVAYLNAPNISVRIAASRAGIDAQLPGYMPSGFSLSGPVEYETGKVVLNFGSGADQRSFSITEEESRWNSESLRENAVANASSDYETVRRGGLTIYVYNGSNASWVNEGIKYTLSGNSQLNEEQLTQIATSL